MFELDKYERKLHRDEAATPSHPYTPVSDVSEMSLLFWGEHCIECAAPSCYESCDLYQARPDKRCRRFSYGSFKNKNFRSLRGYGVEISFKKWAKIEAYANLALQPISSILAQEKLTQLAAPIANVVGKAIGSALRDQNWDSGTYIATERLARHLDHARPQGKLPDAFLLEVYNPGSETVRFQLSFNLSNDENGPNQGFVQLGPSFTTMVSFPSGYSRYEVGIERLQAVIASEKPIKISLTPEADNNPRLVFLAADFVKFKKKPAGSPRPAQIKCVVWDLDNTLWKGVLIEGDSVIVEPRTIELLKRLDDRGILLSIASKNDHAHAWERLKKLDLAEYFLYPQINWLPKSSNIKKIAERLNIGIDTLAFIDDNLFELDQVSQALSEVVCINAANVESLFSDPRFEGSSSADARHRRRFYQEAIDREVAQQEFGTDYMGFLAACGITLEIAEYSAEDSERIAELVQRTNQLNFSGQKYTRSQLGEALANPELEKYVLKSSDKYGSYGTVGFGLVRHSQGIIEVREFMLSCRVQGKFIEQAFFNHLLTHHNPEGATVLWVNFRSTERNKPAKQALEFLGFCDGSVGSDRRLQEGMVHSSPASLLCDFITIRCAVSTAGIKESTLSMPSHAGSRR